MAQAVMNGRSILRRRDEMLAGDRPTRRATPSLLAALVAVFVVVLAASSGTSAAVGTTFTVDTTDGSYDGICEVGDCSLSDAIWEANGNAGKDTIAFDIAGLGPHVIVLPALGTPLPGGTVPFVSDSVVIDGTSEPDYAGIPVIEIDGNGRLRALVVSGAATSGSEVRGLAITTTVFEAIELNNPGGNIVERNFIGTDASGTMPRGAGRGIALSSGGAPAASLENTVADNLIVPIGGVAISLNVASDSHVLRNLIGTDVSGKVPLSNGSGEGIRIVGDRNDVSGNVVAAMGIGISISGSSNDASTDNRIEGNFVGTDITGTVTTDLGNLQGVSISGAPGTVVGGSGAEAGNVISGNTQIGVGICCGGISNADTLVQGNLIGTDISGTVDLGNGGAGISVGGAGTGLLIAGNVVSGNGGNGVVASATTTLSVRIEGNRIGTNAQGTAPIPNDLDGVVTQSGVGASLVSVIGGETAAQRNIISGNRGNGVSVGPQEADDVEVLNNYIGTDVTGTDDVGNQEHGVEAAGSDLVIGKPGAGNLISGNGGAGIHLRAADTVIQANLIGTDESGTSDLGNGGAGVLGSSSYGDVRIGGAAAGEGNLISGNGGWGIELGSAGVGANVIQRNRIGTDITGATAIANSEGGVTVAQLNGMSSIVENVIKENGGHGVRLANRVGSNQVLRNLISGNGGDGVQVLALIQRNAILTNSIFGNAGLGIDLILNDDGVTPNDPGDLDGGPNLRQNFPAITQVGEGGTTIAGTLNSRPDSTYTIELFGNADCDPSGFGEGETLLLRSDGDDTTAVTTDALGNASFTVQLAAPVSVGSVVTATATDSDGNTSEFSQCEGVPEATIVVRKETEPAGSSASFSFASSYGPGFSLRDGESSGSGPLAAGSGYSVSEAVPEGWEQRSATCDDGSPVSNIDVGPGETVTCTFVNARVNRPPDAVDDSLVTPEDTPGSLGVLANDSDPDGDALSVTAWTNGAHGAVTCTAAGACTYTPIANYNGPDSFTYTVADGHGGSDTATVSVTVTPVNDPPDAVDDSLVTAANTAGSVNVLANDSDPDGDALTVTAFTPGLNGTVACTAAGACTHTPQLGFSGGDAFTYTISDGHGGSDTATVRVTVTPPAVDPPPVCTIVAQGKDAAGKAFVRFRVQDTGSGLSHYKVVVLYRTSLLVDPFAVGTTQPVFVTATATSKNGLAVTVDFFDVAGNKVTCDPIALVVAREDDQPEDQTFTNVAQADRYVTIVNGNPGMRKVRLIVNGVKFKERDLAPGETRSFDIASAMKPGNTNTITVSARGKKGASAFIIIADIPPSAG